MGSNREKFNIAIAILEKLSQFDSALLFSNLISHFNVCVGTMPYHTKYMSQERLVADKCCNKEAATHTNHTIILKGTNQGFFLC